MAEKRPAAAAATYEVDDQAQPAGQPEEQQTRQHDAHPERRSRGLQHFVEQLDQKDAEDRYREEIADNSAGVHIHLASSRHSRHSRRSQRNEPASESKDCTLSLSNSDDEVLVVAWDENDPENPYNWSKPKKLFILITCMIDINNSTLGSALPSNTVPYMVKEWNVTVDIQHVLPVSVFLIGYIVGPLLWAPLSEQIGRQYIVISTFVVFMIWTMACALAPNWPAFLVFRLFTGVFASAPVATVAGIYADVFQSPRTRGRAMAMFMVTTTSGPLFAPIISGFCSPTIGWRWTYWIALIYAGFSLVPIAFLPETYGPVLLKRRAIRMRKEDPTANVAAPHELEPKGFRELATVVLTRPLRMILFEMIVTCTCIYLALVYAIFYMTFQAFPLIFIDVYKFSPGVEGLIFMAMGAGALIAIPIFLAYDNYVLNAIARGEAWTKKEEYRRLPLACIGGPAFVVSLFWLGWTSKESISFVSPMLACVPFGMGFILIFMSLVNYMTDAYEIFAASANAASSTSRSVLATVLPLASGPLFKRLTIPGACSLLGGLSLLMCAIPFLFIWKGERLRAGSKFCIALRERKAEMARKVEAQRQRLQERERRQRGEQQKQEEQLLRQPEKAQLPNSQVSDETV